MEIRFASIPKCGSRSLKALGLLGELEGRCHTRIIDYPDWHKYTWFAVDRPEADWMAAWWAECRDAHSEFGHWLGFKYMDMAVDLDRLKHPPLGEAPRRPGVNAWIPENFTADFLSRGLSFKDYCFAIITDGIRGERIQLADLDAWLTERGYHPTHNNKTGVAC